jgi:hypothetical protein
MVAKVYVTTVAATGLVAKTSGTLYYDMHGVAFGWDSSGALRFTAGKAYTNMYAVTRVDAVTAGRWVQVAVTYDGSGTQAGTRFYVDGVEQPKESGGNGSGSLLWANATNQPLQLGTANTYYVSGTLNGRLAYVAVYKGRQLTAAELVDLDSALPLTTP